MVAVYVALIMLVTLKCQVNNLNFGLCLWHYTHFGRILAVVEIFCFDLFCASGMDRVSFFYIYEIFAGL